MENLLQEFKEMKCMPIFEINIMAYLYPENLEIEAEYYVFHLSADDKGVYAGGCTNWGFYAYDGLFEEWDECYSLDEHLFLLHNNCVEWAIKDFEQSLENK